MSSAALRYCGPACSALTRGGKCPQHARQQDMERGSAAARGYDDGWPQYSKTFRQQHVWCGERADGTMDTVNSRCAREGLLTPAQCVDHTVPMRQGGSKWDEANHMACCYACNSLKAKMLER